eukprot:403364293
MSIAQATQGIIAFNKISSGQSNAMESELSGMNYGFHENKKEFNQLKEILRHYKPDKNVARANTIKRRKNKKILLEKAKSNMLQKMSVNSHSLYKKSKLQIMNHDLIEAKTFKNENSIDRERSTSMQNNLNNISSGNKYKQLSLATMNQTNIQSLKVKDTMDPLNLSQGTAQRSKNNSAANSPNLSSARRASQINQFNFQTKQKIAQFQINENLNTLSNKHHSVNSSSIEAKSSANAGTTKNQQIIIHQDDIETSGDHQSLHKFPRYHQTDNNITQLMLEKHHQSAMIETSNTANYQNRLSQIIEDEEEYIYFQYNSDGEANFEEYRSNTNSFFGVDQQNTLKRMKTLQLEPNVSANINRMGTGGSINKQNSGVQGNSQNNQSGVFNDVSSGRGIGERQTSLENDHTNQSNTSFQNNQRQNTHRQYEQLVAPGSFQTLNKLLHNNPNLTFRVENKLMHKNTVDSNISNERSNYGRYLTVNTNLGRFNKLKTQKEIDQFLPDEIAQNSGNDIENKSNSLQHTLSSPGSKVVVLRPMSSQRKSQENVRQSVQIHPISITDQRRNSVGNSIQMNHNIQVNKLDKTLTHKKFNNNIIAIEEELSEHSSPAIYSRRLSMKNNLVGRSKRGSNATNAQQNSIDQSNYSRHTSDLMVSDREGEFQMQERDSEMSQPLKKYTSFLTLNRYNKIYTEEFRDEDIEIMNINSKLTHTNNQLEKLSLYQVIFVILGFFIFVIEVSKNFKSKQ